MKPIRRLKGHLDRKRLHHQPQRQDLGDRNLWSDNKQIAPGGRCYMTSTICRHPAVLGDRTIIDFFMRPLDLIREELTFS
jgi:hypothetical protein